METFDSRTETPSATGWRPILQEPLLRTARQSVFEVARHIQDKPPADDELEQLCANALLFDYLSRLETAQPWGDLAIETLNRVSENLSYRGYRRGLGLFGGLCGIAWVMEHVGSSASSADGAGATPTEDPLEEVDLAILQTAKRIKVPGIYDLISGLVGWGVYFLERWPRPSSVEGLELIVDQLAAEAVNARTGITWHTPVMQLPERLRDRYPDGYFNLGVAHGVPGVIYLLAETTYRGIQETTSRRLLEGAVRWLLATESGAAVPPRFASWCRRDGEPVQGTRLGWCYGDLGIAAVLKHAGSVLQRSDWLSKSKAILDDCIRWSAARGGIQDAGLCHGALGVAQVFNRTYQHTQSSSYRDAAVAWCELGLALRLPNAAGGFYRWHPEHNPAEIDDLSFLNGSVGCALALISAASTVPPSWDRMLLLSGR